MNISIKELNELIYSLGITALNGRMLDKELNQSLMEKLHAELGYQLALEAEDEEADDDGNYLTIPSEDEFPNSVKNEFYDYNSHYVSNEEADEDYRSTLVQDEKRYEKSKVNKGITQSILDVVEILGEMSHTDMHNFYRNTFGSNSFSHILKSLIIPYKNRPTRRYLHKAANGKYVVKIAGLHNWVEKSY
jgi:hypothetical protein